MPHNSWVNISALILSKYYNYAIDPDRFGIHRNLSFFHLFEWKFADLMLVSFLQCKMCASKVSSIQARPIGIRRAVCPGLL